MACFNALRSATFVPLYIYKRDDRMQQNWLNNLTLIPFLLWLSNYSYNYVLIGIHHHHLLNNFCLDKSCKYITTDHSSKTFFVCFYNR
jgi:hypothetical protein